MGARVGLDRQGQGDRACVAYVGDGAFGMSINEVHHMHQHTLHANKETSHTKNTGMKSIRT